MLVCAQLHKQQVRTLPPQHNAFSLGKPSQVRNGDFGGAFVQEDVRGNFGWGQLEQVDLKGRILEGDYDVDISQEQTVGGGAALLVDNRCFLGLQDRIHLITKN